MNLVFILLLINGVFGQSGFGKSYLGDSNLCQPWSCVNKALGLDDSLPTKQQYSSVLKSILPPGPWQAVVDDVLDICYGNNKPRRYTNTCPGQALLHCVVDNFINNCPEESLRRGDACAPVSSLAGFKYMFSQSRYVNFEESIALESRPVWFLKNYFNSKCCNLPQYYNTTILSQCGFNSVVHYYEHSARLRDARKEIIPEVTTNSDVQTTVKETVRVAETSQSNDPLECCDVSDFLPLQSRRECGFTMTWDSKNRLDIIDGGVVPNFITSTSTTEKPKKSLNHDVKVVPLSCEEESCVFRKLGIVSESGAVDTKAFSKLLDNFTNEHPAWLKAKGRVITKCLTKPIKGYETDCDINKVLACTFDVLTENCPHAKSTHIDPCKHTYTMKNDTLCQISSSKYMRHRRKFCDFPRFVPHEVLSQCDVNSINRLEFVPEIAPINLWRKWSPLNSPCKDSTPSTVCMMSKMNVLNKYNFMDHFKIRDQLAAFKSVHPDWSALEPNWDMNSLVLMPLYTKHCSSQRKLLNVIDSMLMNCPASKRRNTTECNTLFNQPISPSLALHSPTLQRPKYQNYGTPPPRMVSQKNGESFFDHFLFRERNLPSVVTIPIEPSKMIPHNHVRIATPVYMRPTSSTFEDLKKQD